MMKRPAAGLDHALEFAIQRIDQNARQLVAFPHVTQDGRWEQGGHGRWTAGFWIGLLWMAYLITGELLWFERAAAWASRLEPRCRDTTTHDMGFLFEPSFVRGWSITREDYYLKVALAAAESLATRYRPRGQYIRAWDHGPDGRAIIDTIMNLDLLYWADRDEIAMNVAETMMREHMRPDGSTYHVVDFDPSTGEVVARGTHQGWSAESCWSRGQAWAIYGFCRVFRRTGQKRFLTAARRAADYFVHRLPRDGLPPWDFDAPPGSPPDTSAAAIAASGLLELDRTAGGYRDVALGILNRLGGCLAGLTSEGILLHGVANAPYSEGVDESLIYGDHYFVEALCKVLRPDLWDALMCELRKPHGDLAP